MPNGKVVVESDQIVTFEVHRTWKGSPSRNLSVYNMSSGSEGHAMIVGRQYLVFAYVMSPEGRDYFGLPAKRRDALIAGCDLNESSNFPMPTDSPTTTRESSVDRSLLFGAADNDAMRRGSRRRNARRAFF